MKCHYTVGCKEKASKSSSFCAKHQAEVRGGFRRRYHERISQGRCPRCGEKNKTLYSYCPTCRKKSAERMRKS